MSKHETWRTRKYWSSTGGYLIEEFYAIKQNKKSDIGKRLIDGIIVLGEEKGSQKGGTYNIENKDIVVVQTNKERLGMYLMGQAFFSREIMKRYNPQSITTVAICGRYDSEMHKLCTAHGIDVVVIPESEKQK